MFGARRRAEDLEAELARTRALLHQVGGTDAWQREQHRRDAEQQLGPVLHEERAARDRVAAAHRELAGLERHLVETREAQLLQEAGVYDYAHPLDTAIAYKDALNHLRSEIKLEVSERRAVTGSVSWTVNGSRRDGAKMVKDISTLMLRAYNAEADNGVRTVKPHTRAAVLARLGKTRATIARLGSTMSIAIAEHYHRLRVREIELTADHLAEIETERELIRAQKEAAREETPAPATSTSSATGSFGDQVVKIGMTRRLEPLDRVRELGDASVR